MMTAKALNLIPSGIEPIDKLQGGLESGHLYLAHGEAAGKSLFGIKFLIEGLKRGESGALVIRYSSEDAVRRFARLGYDCLADVEQGRLVMLEYSDDIINQIQRLSELAPVLGELEWLLKDSNPQRMIFDPVTQLIMGEKGGLQPRVAEFAKWAESFGATVLMVANGNSNEVIQELSPLVKESFKFDFKEIDGRATRFFTFEKSTSITEQAVEVDPSRGVFLLERTPSRVTMPTVKQTKIKEQPESTEAITVEERSTFSLDKQEGPAIETVQQTPGNFSEIVEPVIVYGEATADQQPLAPEHKAEMNLVKAQALYDFSDFLEELDSAIDAIDIRFIETGAGSLMDRSTEDSGGEIEKSQFSVKRISTPVLTPSIEDSSTMVLVDNEKAVGYSKRATDIRYQQEKNTNWATINSLTLEPYEVVQLNPKDFHIVVVDEDDTSCKRVSNTLHEYSVLTLQNSVSGIANIMALNPDLIILDIDMSIADGFKILTHIRASSSAPVIILSKTHIRASDRIFSSELGADYYLTKPFSAKELKQKAKQLIARYRGINSWITSATITETQAGIQRKNDFGGSLQPLIERRAQVSDETVAMKTERITNYARYMETVEANVKRSMERGTSFSIVGYRLEKAKEGDAERFAQLTDLISSYVRNADIVSINPNKELVVLLHDTHSIGARAFISRARRILPEELNQHLSVWMRSFPNLEEEIEPAYTN
jgi:DNA-binding response OmpR family regulator/KaiC/GvpD/RAD55 family RecA-like ATPase